MFINYSLYQRLTKDKKTGWERKTFYVQFQNPDTGTWGSAKSVDMLQKKVEGFGVSHITNRKKAEAIVQKAIEQGVAYLDRTKDVLLSDYLVSFWDFDKSEYIKVKNRLANCAEKNGDVSVVAIGKDYASKMQGYIKNHVVGLPSDLYINALKKKDDGLLEEKKRSYLPKGLKASQLRLEHLQSIESVCLQEVSPKSWQNIKTAISVPLNELKRKKVIRDNPIDSLMSVPVSQRTSRISALTEDEVEKVCRNAFINAHSKVGRKASLSILLAAATGMREGEIMGLRVGDIEIPEIGKWAIINVTQAYALKSGFKTPKSKKTRVTYCDKRLAEELVQMAKANPKKEFSKTNLVFWGDLSKTGDEPTNSKVFRETFYDYLEGIGVTKEDRENRGIVFHSLRHYATTELKVRGATDSIINELIGHESGKHAMNERYTDISSEGINRLANQFGSLIPNLWEAEEELEVKEC